MNLRLVTLFCLVAVFVASNAVVPTAQYNVDVMLNSEPQKPDNGTASPYPVQLMPSFAYVIIVLAVIGAIIAAIAGCAIYTAFKDKLSKQMQHYVHQIELKANPKVIESHNDEEVTISFVSSDSMHDHK